MAKRSKGDNQTIEVFERLDDEMLEEAWSLYEKVGSMASVAKHMNIRYRALRASFLRDPIRMEESKCGYYETVAKRWEVQEEKAAHTLGAVLDMIKSTVGHIQSCAEMETDTDLVDRFGKVMSPQRAIQWVWETRVLDSLHRTGFTSAKIAEGMRQLAEAKNPHIIKERGQASDLTDQELATMVSDLRKRGLPLPPGVEIWAERHGLAQTPSLGQ